MGYIDLFLQISRRFLFLFLIAVVVGCSAQAPTVTAKPSTMERRIQNQIRSQLSVPPNVDIALGTRKPSDVAGYELLPVTLSSGQRTMQLEFLISKDDKTLARLEKFDLADDLMSKIDLTGRPVRGNRDAKVTIVNYDDFQCPFCARMHDTLMSDVLKNYGDKIRIIYKDYPLLSIHPWALHAANNANCLNAQNNDAYWDFADYIHANQQAIMGPQDKRKSINEQWMALDKATLDQAGKHGLNAAVLGACIKAQDDKIVKASIAEGDKLGVDSTPTLFVNGERMSGALPPEVLRAVLDRALRSEGLTPPEAPKVNIVPTPGALPKQ